MTIINLFFIPIIAVYLYCRLNKKEIAPTFCFGLNWAMACVVVSVTAKLILSVERFLFMSAPAEIASAKYSVAALIATVVILVVTKVVKIKVGGQKNEEK